MRGIVKAGLAAFMTVMAGAALAQEWPARPVTMVVPFPSGSATDTIGRIVADRLSQRLGQPVVVENRAGAGSLIGTTYAANASADGYTILFGTNSAFVILPIIKPNDVTFDPVEDFRTIGVVATLPNLLVVSPSLPVNSVSELIQHAKDNPGELSFASSGIGTITHLIGELFKARTGIDVVHVPYSAGVQAAPDLMSGRVDFLFDNILWTLPVVREGKLKGLAITQLNRSALAPDIPTVDESGVSGFEGFSWVGLLAPGNTPQAVVDRLSTELSAIVTDPETMDALKKLGTEPSTLGPVEMREMIIADTAHWREIVREAKIEVEQ